MVFARRAMAPARGEGDRDGRSLTARVAALWAWGQVRYGSAIPDLTIGATSCRPSGPQQRKTRIGRAERGEIE